MSICHVLLVCVHVGFTMIDTDWRSTGGGMVLQGDGKQVGGKSEHTPVNADSFGEENN